MFIYRFTSKQQRSFLLVLLLLHGKIIHIQVYITLTITFILILKFFLNQAMVYKQLRTLLQETDEIAFTIMLDEFLRQLMNDPDAQPFLEYFVNCYANKALLWAYCYRMHTGINTNMHIERMHKTLKYIYLNGKNVQRLDKAISAIMKFVRDKLFDELIALHRGKISSKIKELRVRHKTSLGLDASSIIPTDCGWNIASSSKLKVYKIEEHNTTCKCQLACRDCGVCIHHYRCSCIDSAIKWNMCKHIHLLCKHRRYDATADEQTQTGIQFDNFMKK